MRKFVFLAVSAVLVAATPSLAQSAVPADVPTPEWGEVPAIATAAAMPVQNTIPAVIPAASAWVDIPALAPAVTDHETRAQMNQEIVRAITAAAGDQDQARRDIAAIVARYQENAQSQGARTRPGPK